MTHGPIDSTPPTGTVTFLLTDIVGSTRMWEEDEARTTSLVRQHDSWIERVSTEHDGYVFSNAGDSYAIAFTAPAPAVAAARDIREGMETIGLDLRISVTTGSADERRGGYFGPVLNRCARMMEHLPNGGLVIAHDTLHQAAIQAPPATSIELRDIEEPVDVVFLARD